MSIFSKLFGKPKRHPDEDLSREEIDERAQESIRGRQMAAFEKLENGFLFESYGRTGSIYYKEEGRMMDIFWEMSGVPEYSILVWDKDVKEWIYPDKIDASEEDQKRILKELRRWLRKESIKSDLEPKPRNPAF